MKRNIKEMIDEVRMELDVSKSPRFSNIQVLRMLNTAVDKIIDDRYDNIKNLKSYSFDKIQRVRDELYTVISELRSYSASANVVDFPTDFRNLLNINVTIDGVSTSAYLMSYDEENIIQFDPYDKPTAQHPRYIQSASGIRVVHDGTVFSSAKLSYIKVPPPMQYDETATRNNTVTFNVGDILYVFSGTVTYNTVVYSVGQTFVISSPTSFTGSGLVLVIVNCALPEKLHREVIEVAAAILSGNVEDYNKKQMINVETQRS